MHMLLQKANKRGPSDQKSPHVMYIQLHTTLHVELCICRPIRLWEDQCLQIIRESSKPTCRNTPKERAHEAATLFCSMRMKCMCKVKRTQPPTSSYTNILPDPNRDVHSRMASCYACYPTAGLHPRAETQSCFPPMLRFLLRQMSQPVVLPSAAPARTVTTMRNTLAVSQDTGTTGKEQDLPRRFLFWLDSVCAKCSTAKRLKDTVSERNLHDQATLPTIRVATCTFDEVGAANPQGLLHETALIAVYSYNIHIIFI